MAQKIVDELRALAESGQASLPERIAGILIPILRDEAKLGMTSFKCSYIALERMLGLPEWTLYYDDSPVVEAGKLLDREGCDVSYIYEFRKQDSGKSFEDTEERAIRISWD